MHFSNYYQIFRQLLPLFSSPYFVGPALCSCFAPLFIAAAFLRLGYHCRGAWVFGMRCCCAHLAMHPPFLPDTFAVCLHAARGCSAELAPPVRTPMRVFLFFHRS